MKFWGWFFGEGGVTVLIITGLLQIAAAAVGVWK